MGKEVIVVGGGIAGMQAALSLRERGAEPVIVERAERLGGKLAGWHKLFPTFTPAEEVLGPLRRRVEEAGIRVLTGTEVEELVPGGVVVSGGRRLAGDATVVCSGFELFDARLKEEYGYGIYDNVFTTVDVERMFNEGRVATAQGAAPRRIAFLHCVGSRDEKVGAHHCSRVCCITGVKQAIEMKELFPAAEIYNFYMDIRMFGPGYEELYRRAQLDYHINFVRGRISEASQTIDGRVQIKAEDTLVGRPLKMTVDMLVLIVGMKGGASNGSFARSGGLQVAGNGFMQPLDPFAGNVLSQRDDVFYAGTVTAPKNIGESLNEGVAVAERVAGYLKL
jgi:heterodisulfide reductase subunit A